MFPFILLFLIVLLLIFLVAYLCGRKEAYKDNDATKAVGEFCDKYYGKDNWSFDNIEVFNDQVVFVVVLTTTGGRTDLSVLPRSKTLIVEDTTDPKTPSKRTHKFK